MTDQPITRQSEWQPIRTAPRDGTWFLARTDNGHVRSVHYADKYDRLPIGDPGVMWPTLPTHWMPLPAPPTEERNG